MSGPPPFPRAASPPVLIRSAPARDRCREALELSPNDKTIEKQKELTGAKLREGDADGEAHFRGIVEAAGALSTVSLDGQSIGPDGVCVWGKGLRPRRVCVCVDWGPQMHGPADSDHPQGCIGRGGGTPCVTHPAPPPPPLEGAQPIPSRCLPDSKCRLQWHL